MNLQIAQKLKGHVDSHPQMKYFDKHLRADFVHKGVWALQLQTTTVRTIKGYTNIKEYNTIKEFSLPEGIKS